MKDRKDITVYYNHTLRFENVDDFIQKPSMVYEQSLNSSHSPSFYNSLKKSRLIKCNLDRDTALEQVVHDAQETEMPAYLYKLTLKDTSKFLNKEKQLPKKARKALKELIQSEDKYYEEQHYIKFFLLNIDDKTYSVDRIIDMLGDRYSSEHSIRLMSTIGIDGIDGIYSSDTNGKMSSISIFNQSLIINMECEQVMSPIHDKKTREIPYSSPKEKIDDLKLLRDKIAYDFPIDALLCNPDTGTYHNENIIVKAEDQEPQRIDMGFALAYHARGVRKKGDQWTKPQLGDFYQFRAYNSSSTHYGGLNNQAILDRLIKAEQNMPKVKKAACSKNYTIIEKRLELSLFHFKNLCQTEVQFKENKDNLGVTKGKQNPTSKIAPITALKRLALDKLKNIKTTPRL